MENSCCPSSNTDKTMDSSPEKHASMDPMDLTFTQLDIKSPFNDPTCTTVTVKNALKGKYLYEDEDKDEDELKASFTRLDTMSTFSDTTLCPIPTEIAPFIGCPIGHLTNITDTALEAIKGKNCCCPSSNTDGTMNSSIEKHASMDPKDLTFTQLDIKSPFNDPTCTTVTEKNALKGKYLYEDEDKDEDELEVSFTQLDTMPTFSDPTYPIPTETAPLIEQDQLEPDAFREPTVDTVCRQLCLPRTGSAKVPSVSGVYVSNTYQMADIVFSNTYQMADIVFFRLKKRGEASRDQTPLPTLSWQKESSLRLLRVLGPVCAALVAAGVELFMRQ